MARNEHRGHRERRIANRSGGLTGPARDPEENAPSDEELNKHRPGKDEVRSRREVENE